MSTSSNDRADRIDEKAVAELEAKYDSEMRFRPMANIAATTVTTLLIALSCFHYYTAGFGLLREATHRGVHLAFVLGLIFLVFAFNKKTAAQQQSSWHHPLSESLTKSHSLVIPSSLRC